MISRIKMCHIKIKFMALAMLVISSFGVIINTNFASALAQISDNFYVTDYANVLSDGVEADMIASSKTLEEISGAQLVVLTVQNLEGEDIETYANKFANQNKIGDKDRDNGVLLIFALEERKVRIEVGDGAQGYITDGKSGRIMDEFMIAKLKENNYEEGIKNGYDELLRIMSDAYNTGEMEASKNANSNEGLIIAIVIIAIITLIIILGRKLNKNGGGSSYSSGAALGSALGSHSSYSSHSSGSSHTSGGGGHFSGGGASRGF